MAFCLKTERPGPPAYHGCALPWTRCYQLSYVGVCSMLLVLVARADVIAVGGHARLLRCRGMAGRALAALTGQR